MEGGNTTTPASGQDGNERGKYSINTGDIVLNTKGTNLANNTYGSGTISLNGTINLNGKILTPANNYIECAGRQYINGSEYLYLLNKNGVVIGKDSGGNGNLQVQGNIITPQIKITGTMAGTSFKPIKSPTLTLTSNSYVTISDNGLSFINSGVYTIFIDFMEASGSNGGSAGDLYLYLKENTSFLPAASYLSVPTVLGYSTGNGTKPYMSTNSTEGFIGIFPSKHSNNGGAYENHFYYYATIKVNKANKYYINLSGSYTFNLSTSTFSITPITIYE